MWNNAGLSTSILITTRSPANGMVHHTVAKIFVSTKLRDFGPKSSATRTFWRMVAACIRYQPPTEHLLWDLVMFNLASVRTPWVGTGFLGLAYPFHRPDCLDDTPEFPQTLLICPGDHVATIGDGDVLWRAMATPLPPMGPLEKVQLSLKEGQSVSGSTLRRLRRKEAEIRAAGAEGASLREFKKKQRKAATRTSSPQAMVELSYEKETLTRQPDVALAYQPANLKVRQQKPTSQSSTGTVGSFVHSGHRKVSVEDIERLATFESVSRSARHPDIQRKVLATTTQSHG